MQVCGFKEECMHFILSLLYLGDNTLQEKYYGCRPWTAEVADMYTCVITAWHDYNNLAPITLLKHAVPMMWRFPSDQ